MNLLSAPALTHLCDRAAEVWTLETCLLTHGFLDPDSCFWLDLDRLGQKEFMMRFLPELMTGQSTSIACEFAAEWLTEIGLTNDAAQLDEILNSINTDRALGLIPHSDYLEVFIRTEFS